MAHKYLYNYNDTTTRDAVYRNNAKYEEPWVSATGPDDQIVVNYNKPHIKFEDPEVERICVTTWGDGKHLNYDQAAAVTTNQLRTTFTSNTNITSFDEFKYFTNIASTISGAAVTGASFGACSNLTKISLPTSLTSLGNYTFGNCNNLSVITIPSTITTNHGVFANCTSLQRINITDINNYLNCTWHATNGHPFSASNGGTLWLNGEKVTSVTFPSSITTIKQYALYRTKEITSVTIPSTVTSIGTSAFNGCSNLSNINLTSATTSLGNSSFSNCTNLTSVDLPSGVTTLGEGVFSGCSNLTSITIPNTVTTIGNGAFTNCRNLVNLEIPASVSSIGNTTICTFNNRIGNNTGTLIVHCPIYTTAHTNGYSHNWDFKNLVAEDVTSTASGYVFFHSPSFVYMSVNNIDSVNAFYYHGNGGASPLRFLEIRGTVSSNTSNLFYSGNTYSINNLSIHFAYNGIACPASKCYPNVLTKIYVGDGSSAEHDNAILAQYTADSGWSAYTSKLDTWYNYVQNGGEYAVRPTISN